jgi:hypothetical protein
MYRYGAGAVAVLCLPGFLFVVLLSPQLYQRLAGGRGRGRAASDCSLYLQTAYNALAHV